MGVPLIKWMTKLLLLSSFIAVLGVAYNLLQFHPDLIPSNNGNGNSKGKDNNKEGAAAAAEAVVPSDHVKSDSDFYSLIESQAKVFEGKTGTGQAAVENGSGNKEEEEQFTELEDGDEFEGEEASEEGGADSAIEQEDKSKEEESAAEVANKDKETTNKNQNKDDAKGSAKEVEEESPNKADEESQKSPNNSDAGQEKKPETTKETGGEGQKPLATTNEKMENPDKLKENGDKSKEETKESPKVDASEEKKPEETSKPQQQLRSSAATNNNSAIAQRSESRKHSRLTFLSDKSETCSYDKCSKPSSNKFTNEMGELKDPPSETELPHEIVYEGTCVQGREWHSFTPLNCNNFHEIDTGMNSDEQYGNRMYYLAEGGRRDTWGLKLDMPKEEAIIKSLIWERPYHHRNFDNQRRDALALERLQGSPHVIDVYGFCGMATINEFAGNGNLFKYVMNHRNDIPNEDLLVYARNVSMGLADIQEIDLHYPDTDEDFSPLPLDMPSMLHFDLRHHNMLMMDDNRVKISDFNIAVLLGWDTAKEETCAYEWYIVCGKTIWGTDRAPEECMDKETREERKEMLTTKTEVFHLGNILNFLLTKKKFPFVAKEDQGKFVLEAEEGKEYEMKKAAEIVKKYILKGDLPPLPEDVAKSDDPAVKALIEARDKALIYDVKDRASARDVANILDKAVSKLAQK